MKIRTSKEHWLESEIVAEVVARTGKIPVVTLDGLDVVLEFGEDVPGNETDDITAYFSSDHDLPTVEEREAGVERRAELVGRVAKVKQPMLSMVELQDMVRALAELVGVDLCGKV